MNQLTNDQKAKIYNQLLFKYQRLQEQVRQIRAENINVSEADQKKINLLEIEMKRVFNETQKLY